MQSLTAFTGARIPHILARPRRANQSDRLGTDVLPFEFASLKFRGIKQIFVAMVFENVLQRIGAKYFAVAQFRRQRPALPWTRAQPYFRFRLNRAQPIGRDFHFIAQPFRDHSVFEIVVGEFERILGKFAGELQSMVNLVFQWLPLVQPAEPAVISEYRAANLGASNLGQSALGLKL